MSELNKTEALKYLQISERTLERWVKKYKIAVRHENTEHGRQPFFEQSELDRVREERSPTYRPAISGKLAPIVVSEEDRYLIQIAGTIEFCAEIMARSQLIQQLNLQLTLSLDEAAVLSGLGRSRLLKAIKLGELNAKKLPGWRVRQQDLREYIDVKYSG